MNTKSFEVCILGAGPAGLGAAQELTRSGVTDILIVDRNHQVGGLARTEHLGGGRFDVGPHRFFTKNSEVNRIWHQALGDDFQPGQRLTRIFYNQKFFSYPIKPWDAVSKLGLVESTRVVLSYLAAMARPTAQQQNFEQWMIAKFGYKLYSVFFKTYTEKVWGIPCAQISAEWAAQRIKGLDIIQVLKSALFRSGGTPKTLVEEFDYPVLGAGQMYEALASQAVAAGATLMMGTRVVGARQKDDHITEVTLVDDRNSPITVEAGHFMSSIPLTHLIKMLEPGEDQVVLNAADSLYYRDHITVDLLLEGDDYFPDQWIYLHDPQVQMARLANYINFSKAMVDRPGTSALSVEYFVFQHEPLWGMTDEMLIDLGKSELAQVGLIAPRRVEQAWVVRETESYPTYYLGFAEPYRVLQERLDRISNLSPIGRGGMYKYNNQDHSIYSGLLAARNYVGAPGAPYDLWKINIDAQYHESAQR